MTQILSKPFFVSLINEVEPITKAKPQPAAKAAVRGIASRCAVI